MVPPTLPRPFPARAQGRPHDMDMDMDMDRDTDRDRGRAYPLRPTPLLWLCLLFYGVGLLLVPGGGLALAQDKPSVAVLEVTGAPRAQQVAINIAKGNYTYVPMSKWNAAAKKLGATGRAADEIAIVAAELRVAVVVTGNVKKDKESGQWTLTVSARHGASGKAVGKLKYPLKGQRVDPATLRKLAEDLAAAIDKAQKGPVETAPEPEPVATAKPEIVPDEPPAGKDDDPFERLRKQEEEDKARKNAARPVWYPFVDAGVGFVLGGRRFAFDEDPGPGTVKCYDFDKSILDPNDPMGMRTVFRYTNALKKCPGFAASIAGGLRVDATAYPLAWLRINALRGLGIGATLDYMFWPPSKVCNKNADGVCVTPGAELDTRELRAEIGLRWHWNILNKRSRPSILLMFQYGLHQFAIQKQEKTYDVPDPSTGVVTKVNGVDDHGLPDILYQYLDLGLGGRVPFYATDRWYIGMQLDFHYHIMLDYGDIQTRFIDYSTFNGGYGPINGGYGLRLNFNPIEYVWRGLTVRLNGYFEMFSMAFELASADKGYQLPPTNRDQDGAARHIAQGATDYYFGGVVQVGYQY